MTRPMLTLADVAERLNLPEKRVRTLLVSQKLCAYVKIGRTEIRVDADTLETWIRASESASLAISPMKGRRADF